MMEQLRTDERGPAAGALRRIEKPWGYELIFAHTDRYVGKILHIRAGHRLSRQYHRAKEETLMVESGELELEIGGDAERVTVRMRSRDVFHVAPRTIHRLVGLTDVDVIEVSTTELEDVVRLADDYGRESDRAVPVLLASVRESRRSRRVVLEARSA